MATITVTVTEHWDDCKRHLEYWRKPISEPLWFTYLRLMFLIWALKFEPIEESRQSDGSIDLRFYRKRWFTIPIYYWETGYEKEREVEIEFSYWWNDSEPEVGYAEPWPDFNVLSARYTDTGVPYKGDVDVWNDDILQWIGDNGEDW